MHPSCLPVPRVICQASAAYKPLYAVEKQLVVSKLVADPEVWQQHLVGGDSWPLGFRLELLSNPLVMAVLLMLMRGWRLLVALLLLNFPRMLLADLRRR